MKSFALVALFAAVVSAGKPPHVGLGHAYVPATRETYDNASELWKGNWAKYRAAHPNDQDCSVKESNLYTPDVPPAIHVMSSAEQRGRLSPPFGVNTVICGLIVNTALLTSLALALAASFTRTKH